MNILKRMLAAFLVLSSLLSVISCGEYKPATDGGRDPQNKYPEGSADQPQLDGDPTNDFSVQLRLNEQTFIPTVSMNVYWSDGYNVHIAPVDESGYAVIDGLDGDYNVTLSSVPSGYAYDPNAYVATNDNRHIVIDMYDLNLLRGSGAGIYECYQINSPGVYTVTIRSEEDFSFIEFAPQINGVYTVESWVNIVDDEVSPICIGYLGSSQYKYGEYRVTDVGICGSYTRNFIHTVNIADENISTGGSQTFTFAVGGETKSGVYPINLTFAVKRNGGFDLNLKEKITMLPTQDWSAFDFDAFNALAGGEIVGAETLYPGTTNSYIFDQDNYKLWEISQGGDGVYHVYDPEKYPETNGYGPILVVYITEPCRFIAKPFTTIEEEGNSALVVNGTDNYRLLIKGYQALAEQGYYCVNGCPCHPNGGVCSCLPGCSGCTKDCSPATAEEQAVKGYASIVNNDGVAPVTPEIVAFLQGFAITQRYFADGDGWVEGNAAFPVDAYEDSQWLFACGYYKD